MEWHTLASGFGLAEGPTVLPDGSLVVSDVLDGGVHRIAQDGSVEVVVPKRRGVGGIATHADGGLLVSGRDLQWVHDGASTTMFTVEGSLGFNDFATDAAGRVYIGTVRYRSLDPDATVVPGDLWRVDLDGTARQLYSGVLQCNGVGLSPDEGTIYHSDTRGHCVIVHDLRDDGAAAVNRREWSLGERGMPDGLAVDAAGDVWVTDHGAGRIVRFHPDGSTAGEVPLPFRYVTSVCFRDDELIVVGARHRDTPGSVIAGRVSTTGAPVHPARIATPVAA